MSAFYLLSLDRKLCIVTNEDGPANILAGNSFKEFCGFDVVEYTELRSGGHIPRDALNFEAMTLMDMSQRIEGWLVPTDVTCCTHGIKLCMCGRNPPHGMGCLKCHRELKQHYKRFGR